MCEGVFGIKTGFTKKSGRCLVSACERDDVVLVAVTLNAGDDWNDHIKLYEYGYDKITDKQVHARVPERVRVYGGSGNFVLISPQENPVKISVCNEDYKITQKIILPDFVYAPIMKGDSVGKVQLLTDNKVICERDIVCTQSITTIGNRNKTTYNLNFSDILEKLIFEAKNIYNS
jgi:D-alanyl-D-alanine carboxypeptidase/D-alanyl-D-alanine carboxypeptidase (penicillin-binding protein 5/6)